MFIDKPSQTDARPDRVLTCTRCGAHGRQAEAIEHRDDCPHRGPAASPPAPSVPSSGVTTSTVRGVMTLLFAAALAACGGGGDGGSPEAGTPTPTATSSSAPSVA